MSFAHLVYFSNPLCGNSGASLVVFPVAIRTVPGTTQQNSSEDWALLVHSDPSFLDLHLGTWLPGYFDAVINLDPAAPSH